jgi:peptidoglycan/LPS O-acetylase OafA/YrhL
MPVSKPQILPLTGMRFFLPLWVVVFHHTGATGILRVTVANAPSAVSSILRTGYVAVGIFFVLSGFILSYNYKLAQPWSREAFFYACFPFVGIALWGRSTYTAVLARS